MRIEPVSTKDSKELLSIYKYYIKETSQTLEYQIPKLNEFEKEMRRICQKYPFYKVVGKKKEILGFGYLTELDPSGGKMWSAQMKLFVKSGHQRNGIGQMLCEELEKDARKMGLLNLSACIHTTEAVVWTEEEPGGIPERGSLREARHSKNGAFHLNLTHDEEEITGDGTDPTIAFFQKQGFQLVGSFQKSGYKYKKWHNTVWMEKSLGEHTIEPGQIAWMKRKIGRTDFKKRMEILALCLLFLVTLPVGFGIYYFEHYYEKSNYVGDDNYTLKDQIGPVTYYDENGNLVTEEEAVLDPGSEEELIARQEAALKDLEQYAEEFDKGTYNMLLIGIDRREGETWNGNSDVMVLVTVNDYTKTVYMTSFLRDLYANIPDVGVRKLNAACAYGGPQLCVETIKSNYGVTIDNWALVDFEAMREVIDVCGGIYLDVSEEEGAVANQYITAMCREAGVDPKMHLFYYGGWQHLDGFMAVGYSRNRYTGGANDFGRTERQRKVLNALIRQVSTGDFNMITNTINEALPHVTHDVTRATLVNLLTKLPVWFQYNIVQQHVPFDNDWTSQNEILVPSNMELMIQRLTSTIYAGKPDYLDETQPAA